MSAVRCDRCGTTDDIDSTGCVPVCPPCREIRLAASTRGAQRPRGAEVDEHLWATLMGGTR